MAVLINGVITVTADIIIRHHIFYKSLKLAQSFGNAIEKTETPYTFFFIRTSKTQVKLKLFLGFLRGVKLDIKNVLKIQCIFKKKSR